MSYCVNCGVELDDTAKKCVLCDTPVVNPRKEINSSLPSPYPKIRENIEAVSKSTFGKLITCLIALPDIVCLLINVIYGQEKFWSVFVIGASLIVWVVAALPFFFRRPHPILYVALSGVSVALYIMMISIFYNGPEWFIKLALPICVMSTVFAAIVLTARVRWKASILTTLIIFLSGLSIWIVAVEALIDYYAFSHINLAWSFIVAASIISLVIFLIIVKRSKKLKEEIKRRTMI